ncbi:tubulin epsilon chain [Plasmodium brasilianum]|uniref:Tubulin epsilon chain, putative n=2 Tax=Plasmodium (Plasmodium) TaxID=418103 RepID=A0A1A8WUK7_PLAMA|nr:tubulin epsilon chain, putative [Plasmodium malariae]KAI4836904.1 tubulin epsilon chain [Plasmodium brasilianum]SBS96610.1 tubulin epsilon chain, putative [Plasmodium malariae]SCO94206.1 tubulin epsilon chain, putative [Plasmodium malariae]
MVREIIFLHVGQCGNQLGHEFWSVAIKEHLNKKINEKRELVGKHSFMNDSASSFFENVYKNFNLNQKESLKARAILIDTETGVANEIMKSSISPYFDENNIFTQHSGAGNNWSQGYMYYGKMYETLIDNIIRKNVEKCDSLQSFYITSSLGGGTGSGLGSYILEMLSDNYKQIKFSNCVFPSACDDVITSPYNSFFALTKIHEFSNCVLPVSNDALLDILNSKKLKEKKNDKNDYSKMNNIVANVILNLTSSMRFEGSLNVDINEICTNLIPYPFFNFMLSSLSPCVETENIRTFDHLFKNVLNRNNQMLIANPKDGLSLSMAFLVRGNINISDVTKNVLLIKNNLNILRYNKDATKIGLCNVSPLNQPYSLLCLINSCEIRNSFLQILERFNKLFKRKAHLHHYLEYLTMDDILEFKEKIQNLIFEYSYIQKNSFCSPKFLNRNTINILGYDICEENDTHDNNYINLESSNPYYLKSKIKKCDKSISWFDFKTKPII